MFRQINSIKYPKAETRSTKEMARWSLKEQLLARQKYLTTKRKRSLLCKDCFSHIRKLIKTN